MVAVGKGSLNVLIANDLQRIKLKGLRRYDIRAPYVIIFKFHAHAPIYICTLSTILII